MTGADPKRDNRLVSGTVPEQLKKDARFEQKKEQVTKDSLLTGPAGSRGHQPRNSAASTPRLGRPRPERRSRSPGML